MWFVGFSPAQFIYLGVEKWRWLVECLQGCFFFPPGFTMERQQLSELQVLSTEWNLGWSENTNQKNAKKYKTQVWWWTLYVNLTGLRVAHIGGRVLFLVVSVKVLLEEINIWISKLRKKDLLSPVWMDIILSVECPPPIPIEQRNREVWFLFFSFWTKTSIFLDNGALVLEPWDSRT